MIIVNGKAYKLETIMSLEQFLQVHNYRTARVAVERNGSIVARIEYGNVILEEGDKVEIVSFVGGG